MQFVMYSKLFRSSVKLLWIVYFFTKNKTIIILVNEIIFHFIQFFMNFFHQVLSVLELWDKKCPDFASLVTLLIQRLVWKVTDFVSCQIKSKWKSFICFFTFPLHFGCFLFYNHKKCGDVIRIYEIQRDVQFLLSFFTYKYYLVAVDMYI